MRKERRLRGVVYRARAVVPLACTRGSVKHVVAEPATLPGISAREGHVCRLLTRAARLGDRGADDQPPSRQDPSGVRTIKLAMRHSLPRIRRFRRSLVVLRSRSGAPAPALIPPIASPISRRLSIRNGRHAQFHSSPLCCQVHSQFPTPFRLLMQQLAVGRPPNAYATSSSRTFSRSLHGTGCTW